MEAAGSPLGQLTVLRLVLRAVMLQLLAAAVAALAGLQRLLEEALGLHDGGGLLLGQQDVGRRTAAARGTTEKRVCFCCPVKECVYYPFWLKLFTRSFKGHLKKTKKHKNSLYFAISDKIIHDTFIHKIK